MKQTCLVLLAVIISIELHAQTNFYNQSQFNLQPLRLKSSTGKFKETTYHIGVEYGRVIYTSGFVTEEIANMLGGYLDVSLVQKILYFRLESGVVTDGSFKGGAGFLAIGVNYGVKKFNRHIIYLLIGAEGWASDITGLFVVIHPKYVFMLSNVIGLSAGVRYMPLVRFDPLDIGKGYLSVSAGIQFFH
jgi:hypothetical protein